MKHHNLADLELLKNDGILVLNAPSVPCREKTVVVLGAARGGTTMVASVLRSLGVFMGERLGPVLEDVALSRIVEARDADGLKRIVEDRNGKYPVWGWKRPAALEYSDVWNGCLRNLHVIAVFRDPFAIANRNRISMLSDVFHDMERSLRYFHKLADFLKTRDCPQLLCSYEKALASPENFVRAVDEFLGLNAGPLRAGAALQIRTAPKEYLESSRITHSLGHLDVANEQVCAGWAFYREQPDRIARVQIYVNGNPAGIVEARLPRPDLKQGEVHSSGLCGFRMRWAPGSAPRIGDVVEARVEGEPHMLNGSPKHATARR